MKIICNQSKLADAVSNVQRVVSTKTSVPALEGILLKAVNNKITVCGYDLEIGITTTIDAKVLEEGSVVVNARLFSDIIRRLPDENVTIDIDDKLITYIESGNANYKIVGINAEQFPELPTFEKMESLEIESGLLKNMIKQTLFAISDNLSKPIFTGSLFNLENNEFRVISVDGFRMALRKEIIKCDNSCKFVVPKKTLEEIIKLNSEEDSIINIAVGQRHAIFNIENYVIHTRLLEGMFLDYKETFPKEFITQFPIGTRELTNSVERMSLLTSEKIKSPIRIDIEENNINLSCSTSIGKAQDVLNSTVSGELFEIGFNNRYLLDALKNADTDLIMLKLNGPVKPMIIEPVQGDSFVYLVVPMRLNNEKKGEKNDN